MKSPTNSLSRRHFYPLAQRPVRSDWVQLRLGHLTLSARLAMLSASCPLSDSEGKVHRRVKAMWTGEFRPVKKGEWFLSGAIIEAYRWTAEKDSADPWHIARLVQTVIVAKVTEELCNE